MKFEGNHELPSLEFIEDEGIIKIWGRSIANEPKDFWVPLREKLDDYLNDPRDIVLSIDLEYFNTPSAIQILSVLKILKEKLKASKRKLLVKWISDDDNMVEAGEDYHAMLGFGDWKFINKEND